MFPTTGSNVTRKSRMRSLEALESKNLLAADLVSVGPLNDSTFVAPDADIVLTFDEAVALGTGNIEISSDGEVIETIDVTDATKVSMDGGVVTVNPDSDLPPETTISVSVDEGAFNYLSVEFFSEGFEDVELIPFVDEAEIPDNDMNWSEELPDGWEKDNTDTSDAGPVEFFGFTIFDKESWVTAAGNQDRDEFTRGEGNVVVADGDEYDDIAGAAGDNQFNVFLTSPEIDLSGVGENEAYLEFDSSFRPEADQTGLVDISYDGGSTWETLLELKEGADLPRSTLARANVRERLAMGNAADATAIVRFGMVEADNNWWWAIDNVAVEIPGEGAAFGGADWSFTTAPTLSPPAGSVGVSLDANLSITFGRDIVKTPGLGNVEIYNAADDSLVEAIPVASDRVSADGPTLTIDPINDLDANTEYYVTIDDFSIWDTEDVNVAGITLLSEDFEGLTAINSGLVGGENIDHYVVVMSGVLDVTEAGTYTFGGNADDGQLLSIDVEQDGLDLLDDEIIFNEDGTGDRLSTCAFDTTLTSCEGEGDPGIELEVGEYEFEFWYYETTGGSGGEFFYAKGSQEIFSADEFALVGDGSKGIGISGDGITATAYVSAVEDESIDTITDFARAELLVDGTITQVDGFPATVTLATADIWNTGGTGRYGDDNTLPGLDEPDPEFDWSPEAPEGWTRDNSFLEENRPGGPPEYFGWNLLDKDFWIAEQGDQSRTQFTLGEGLVAVVDPDAYDDFIGINSETGDNATECLPLDADERTAGADCGYFNASISTPPISLEGVDDGAASLSFDSSWRDETTQSAEVTVEFFDADGESISEEQLLRWESMSDDVNYKPAATNETVDLELDNPEGAASFVASFTMPYAQNDWWWAIDNIRVTTAFSGNPIAGVDAGSWSFTTGDGEDGGPSDNFLFGDLDEDGVVEFPDFLLLSGAFGSDVEPFTVADIDGSGSVDFQDFLVLSGNFNKEVPEAAAAPVAAVDAFFASEDDEDEADNLLAAL